MSDFMVALRNSRLVIAYECYKMQRTTLAPKGWGELGRVERKKALDAADRIIGAIKKAIEGGIP